MSHWDWQTFDGIQWASCQALVGDATHGDTDGGTYCTGLVWDLHVSKAKHHDNDVRVIYTWGDNPISERPTGTSKHLGLPNIQLGPSKHPTGTFGTSDLDLQNIRKSMIESYSASCGACVVGHASTPLWECSDTCAEGAQDHIGQSYFPAPSGELEMTSNRKLRVGPSQWKSTNSRSRAWAHLYKLPHVVGGPIL